MSDTDQETGSLFSHLERFWGAAEMLSIPAQVTEEGGHSAPVQTACEPDTGGFGVSHTHTGLVLVHQSAFPYSTSKGPDSLPGIHHTSLHPAVQQPGAILTCRAEAYPELSVTAWRIGSGKNE